MARASPVSPRPEPHGADYVSRLDELPSPCAEPLPSPRSGVNHPAGDQMVHGQEARLPLRWEGELDGDQDGMSARPGENSSQTQQRPSPQSRR